MAQVADPSSFGLPAAPPSVAPPPRRRRWWIVALAVTVGVVAGVVAAWPQDETSSRSHAAPGTVEEAATAPGEAPATHERLPVAEARVEGTYHVRAELTSAYGWESLHVGSVIRGDWYVNARCASGACDIGVQGTSSGGSWSMRLERVGAMYRGTARAQLSQCFMSSVTDDLTLRLRVQDAKWDGDVWTAATFTGTMRDVSPASSSGLYTCPGSGWTASVSGTLRR